MKCKSNIIILSSNYAWTVYNFRMPLIRRLQKEGFKVCVLTQYDGFEDLIAKEAYEVRPLFISRKGLNPLVDLITFFDYVKNFIQLRPVLVLSFTIKPVIYGSLAARLIRLRSIATITGLGTAFISDNWLTNVVKILYKASFGSLSTVFFQNTSDARKFIESRLISPTKYRVVPGSGIDVVKFSYNPLPQSDLKIFLFIGRLLGDKGVIEFIDAARIIRHKHPNTRFQLLGPVGVENRTAIPKNIIEEWQEDGYIQYLGESDDVVAHIERATCIVLPSYREGISRVLLEAAAVGRPLIASDVPGCKEVIEDGVNGFLCKPRDALSLASKMELITSSPHHELRLMGSKGREKVKREFNQELVCDMYVNAIVETCDR